MTDTKTDEAVSTCECGDPDPHRHDCDECGDELPEGHAGLCYQCFRADPANAPGCP